MSERILRAFLRGWVLGDGSMHGNRVQGYTVSKTLALHLQLALARFGRLACITPQMRKVGSIRGRPVNGGEGFHVVWRWKNERHERYKTFNDYIAVPVQSVRITPYDGVVVDVETTSHTFTASNVVIHNSFNLQDADLAIFAQLPINYRELWQWEGRFARHGQKRPVLIVYPVAESSIDERLQSILLDKLPAVAALHGDSGAVEAEQALFGQGREDEIIDSLFAAVMQEPTEETTP